MTIDLDTDFVVTPGAAICYEIKGNKVVIKPVVDEFVDTTDWTIKINENTKSYIAKGDTDKAFIDSSVKFVNVQPKANDYDEVKATLVSFEDLDVISAAKALDADGKLGYLVDYDKDAKTVGAVIYKVDLDRAKENNFAVVVAKSNTEVDDEDAYEYDVIFTDGSKATYYATASGFGDDYDDLEIGDAYDIAVTGDELTDADAVDVETNLTSTSDKLADIKVATDIDTKYNEITVGNISYAFSEDVLVLEKDGSKYIVRDITNITELDETLAKDLEVDKLVKAFKAKDDDNNFEVVVIIYDTDVKVLEN